MLYFALQKIGCIPIAALATHRYNEVSQFVAIAEAVACVYPERQSDFEFPPMIRRIAQESPLHALCDRARHAGPGRAVADRADRAPGAAARVARWPRSRSIRPIPCIFQLSGGTTGRAQAHPAHAQRLCLQLQDRGAVCGVNGDSVLLLALPIAHNLPLACPGIQGFMFNGGKIVLSRTTRPEEMFPLVEKHRVTHIKVVPALLIRLINSPLVTRSIPPRCATSKAAASGFSPKCASAPANSFPSAFVQENFGMSEGMLFFVRRDDPEDVRLETVGRPISPDDEVRLLDDDDREVRVRRGRRALRARTLYAARLLRHARAQPARLHPRRVLPLRRSDAAAPVGQLHGRGPQEGPHQPRRREDQRRGDREPDPPAPGGAERRLRRHARSRSGRAHVCLRHPARGASLCARRSSSRSSPARRSPGSSCRSGSRSCTEFPLSTFGKVSKKMLVEMVTDKLADEHEPPRH